VARDSPAPRASRGNAAGALARRPGAPATPPLDVAAPASGVSLHGIAPPHTPADGHVPTASAQTNACTRCIAWSLLAACRAASRHPCQKQLSGNWSV